MVHELNSVHWTHGPSLNCRTTSLISVRVSLQNPDSDDQILVLNSYPDLTTLGQSNL